MPELFHFPRAPSFPVPAIMPTPAPRWGAGPAREREVLALAKRLRLDGKVREHAQRFLVEDPRGTLEVFEASGSLRWTRAAAAAGEPPDPGRLPSRDEAAAKAERFLADLALLDGRAQLADVTYGEVIAAPRGGAPRAAYPTEIHVHYRFTLNGIPVVGPGAKIQVTFGTDGQVSEFYRFWRETAASLPPLPSYSLREAIALLRQDRAFLQLSPARARVQIRRIFLGYYAGPPRKHQGFLVPVYVFHGTVRTPALRRYDFVRHVAAVRLSRAESLALGPAALTVLRR
jgi:hypothetical protein